MAHDWRQSLLRWQAEGLLTARQAELILVFEQSRLRRRAASAPFRVLALLGGLCMTVGLGTLVAYNWAQIGAGVKLGALGLLLFSAAAVCVILRERAPHLVTARDVAIGVTAGLCLAGLGLVSQIYEQDGDLWQLLLVWCALVAPIYAWAQGRLLSAVVFASFWCTLVSAGSELDSMLSPVSGGSSELVTALLVWTAGAWFGLRFLASRSAARQEVGRGIVWMHVAALGLGTSFLWFDDGRGAAAPALGVGCLLSVVVVAWGAPGAAASVGFGSRSRLLALVATALATGALAGSLELESGFAAFLAFCLFWGLAYRFAEDEGHGGTARFAVMLLALRIVMASFELFESLLVSGLTLVVLGAAALLLARRGLGTEGGQA